jgi:hypothetical protein
MRLGGAIGRCGIFGICLGAGVSRPGKPGMFFFFPERTRMRKLLYMTRDAATAGRQAQLPRLDERREHTPPDGYR